jgi:hypothetical protein
MDNIVQINVELFKQAFYEIDKAEKENLDYINQLKFIVILM